MKKEWYIFINSGHIGPYSLIEMKAFYDKRDIKENTMIWREGMKEWLPLKKVDLFTQLSDDVPPPLPPEIFNLPKTVETLSIPSILQPAPEEVYEGGITSAVKIKSQIPRNLLASLVFVIILVAGIFIYKETATPDLRIKGISPYNREQLENQLAIDAKNMSFAVALSMDKGNLWIASNQKENLSVTIDLAADTKRLLGDENQAEGLVRLQGMIVNHLGHFTKMQILKGTKFFPGEYNVHIKGKKIHWLNKYLKLNKHELDLPFVFDFKTLIFSGNSREFERKLVERRLEKVNKLVKPLQDKMEALQTLKSLLNKNMEIFTVNLEKSNTGHDFAGYEKSYIKDVGPIVQVIVLAAHADLQKDVEHKTLNEAIVDIGKRIGEEVSEMINEVNALKKIESKTRNKLHDYYQKKTERIDSMIKVYLGQVEAQIKELQSQTPP